MQQRWHSSTKLWFIASPSLPVKYVLSVLIRALRRARHFALVEDVPIQPRLARNHCRSGTQAE